MSTINPGIIKGTLDTEIKALASTVSSADTIPYFTGLGTASSTTFTSMARNLLDDPDAATMRTTLDVEQHKANLTAIGALVSTTDTIPYFTGSGSASVTAFTSMARNLLDDVDAVSMRTTIDAQQANSNLTAIAGLTSATDTIPYFTGSGTASTTSITAQARTLLAATDAASQRAVIGAASTGKAIAMAIVFGG